MARETEFETIQINYEFNRWVLVPIDTHEVNLYINILWHGVCGRTLMKRFIIFFSLFWGLTKYKVSDGDLNEIVIFKYWKINQCF